MKKERNKKVLILSLVLLSLIMINLVLVAAQTTSTEPSLWERWKAGALKNTDAKILILLMTMVIIYALLTMMDIGGGVAILISAPFAFVLTAFVTPESVLGIIRSYNTLPLAIATILPLIVLFLVTYVSVMKGSRSLMTLQLLGWAVYFLFNAFIFLAYWGWLDWIADPAMIASMVSLPVAGGAEEGYFWFALLIRTVIAGIMTFSNGFFMNSAMRWTLGIDKAVWKSKMKELGSGMDTLLELGKKMEGKKSTY